MNDKIKGFIAGILCTTIVSGLVLTTSASQLTRLVEIAYNNIKICIDGIFIEPKDATGKVVEPFILDGTTYLPVRAVANALGKEVSWDNTTKTVYLGEKPVTETSKNMSFDQALEKLKTVENKSELDNETLLTIEGVPVSAATVKYANLACRQSFGVTDDVDEATLEEINKQINEYYLLNIAILKLNQKYNLPVTEEEYNKQIVEYIGQTKVMYGDEYEMIVNDYMFQTPYFVAENALLNIGYAHLYDYFFGANGISDKKQEIYDKSLSQLKKQDYIRAKHILIAFPENSDKNAKAKTLEKANEVLAKVNAGEDFDALIAQYGEDPGMVANPDGYVFTKGEMVPEFEEAAYALEIGEHSELVETTYGYHIILKLDLEGDALYNSEIYLNNAYIYLREMLVEESSKYEIEYADNYNAKVSDFIAEYKERFNG